MLLIQSFHKPLTQRSIPKRPKLSWYVFGDLCCFQVILVTTRHVNRTRTMSEIGLARPRPLQGDRGFRPQSSWMVLAIPSDRCYIADLPPLADLPPGSSAMVLKNHCRSSPIAELPHIISIVIGFIFTYSYNLS